MSQENLINASKPGKFLPIDKQYFVHMSLNNKNFKGLAARQFTARKTTLPQNILAAVRSSFNHPPFHHIMHLVRNRVGVPKDRAWLVPHLFTVSPLCVGAEKPERPCALSRSSRPLWAAQHPLAAGRARSCSCQLCSLPLVPASCVCCLRAAPPCLCRQSGCSALPAAGCSRVLPDYFT